MTIRPAKIHLEKAIAFLKPLLQERWRVKPCFSAIFIEHGPVIASISVDGSNHFTLNELWEPS